MKYSFQLCLAIPICLSSLSQPAFASDNENSELDLEALLNQRVELHRESDTASGVSESIIDTPASMVVITKSDIKKRGYTSLDDIMSDLPGFDSITTNGTLPVISYQRGYRTPFTQRTLLLINGKVDNNMWNQTAVISKQYSMQAIERVEVLYGPAGAVYGPNAFLGVINIITKDAWSVKDGQNYASTQVSMGSYGTYGVDFTMGGRDGDLAYVLSGKFYESDGADLDAHAPWGFLDESLLTDVNNWGNAISNSDFNNDGTVDMFGGNQLGTYGDPTSDYSLMGEVALANIKAGFIHWATDEAYGPYYPFDKVQPNVSWLHQSSQFYIEHSTTLSDVAINTEMVYRENMVGGYWAESYGGYVSLSNWNAYSEGARFKQQYSYNYSDNLQLSGGIKLEKKDLTKAYIACGYWSGNICPAEGGYSDGSAIKSGDDRDVIDLPGQITRDEFVPYSLISTTDKGAYVQAIYTQGKFRFNGGLRIDHNSEYGSVVNPRAGLIYRYTPDTTVKLIYGEAFQEPSPKDLYGGFSARGSDPDLKPETIKNIEFIAMHQFNDSLHQLSIYNSEFSNVIVNAGSGNVGGRSVQGMEYKADFNFTNPLFNGEDITTTFYYTYTNADSEFQYVQGLNTDGSAGWIEQEDKLGDIAPHKINLFVDVPITEQLGLNFQYNYVHDRILYSENPLRAAYNNNRDQVDDREAQAYQTLDIALRYLSKGFEIGLKVDNVFGETYYHPGVEGAGSGDDFSQPSQGFSNSLIPQINEATYLAYFTLNF